MCAAKTSLAGLEIFFRSHSLCVSRNYCERVFVDQNRVRNCNILVLLKNMTSQYKEIQKSCAILNFVEIYEKSRISLSLSLNICFASAWENERLLWTGRCRDRITKLLCERGATMTGLAGPNSNLTRDQRGDREQRVIIYRFRREARKSPIVFAKLSWHPRGTRSLVYETSTFDFSIDKNDRSLSFPSLPRVCLATIKRQCSEIYSFIVPSYKETIRFYS